MQSAHTGTETSIAAAYGGSHFDWPLSSNEKRYHIMQLYDRELQAVACSASLEEGAVIDQPFSDAHRVDSKGSYNRRLSEASTADTEIGSVTQQLFDDNLHPIHEEQDCPDVTMHLKAEESANKLLQAVAHAVETLRCIEHHHPGMSLPSSAPSVVHSTSGWRRAASEEVLRSSKRRPSRSGRDAAEELTRSSTRRTSYGRRNSRYMSHVGTGKPVSRSATPAPDCANSDGGEGDTEDTVEITTARCRQRYSDQNRREDEKPVQSSLARSRSVPAARPIMSLQDFLGESVPTCPF